MIKESSSHPTRRWRKVDSNSWSRFEKTAPFKLTGTEFAPDSPLEEGGFELVVPL